MAKKRGRPKINIDWTEFDKLCLIQCTLEEIADWFECSIDTIENRCKSEKRLIFSEYFKKKSVGGKISLRRKQFQMAQDGNVALLIFLGKQYLGQKDKPEDGTNNDKPQPIKIEIIAEDGRLVQKEVKNKGNTPTS